MLSDVPNGLACLLRGSVQKPADEWANHLEERRLVHFDQSIRDDLPEKFIAIIKSTPLRRPEIVLSCLPGSTATTLYEAVLEYACILDFENFKSFRDGSLEIIRQLRKTLATLCIDYIDADLFILDEFQRFRDLIDQESESEAAAIAKQIFQKPDTKILLLSATPFKAFTGDSDLESGEEHYKELSIELYQDFSRTQLRSRRMISTFVLLIAWRSESFSLKVRRDTILAENWGRVHDRSTKNGATK